jgi:tetratricopeptide (TPR) repeat protein
LNLGKPYESLKSIAALLKLLKNCELNGNENKSIQRNALANASVISAQLKHSNDAKEYLAQLESCFEDSENKSLLHSSALTIFLLERNAEEAYAYILQNKGNITSSPADFEIRAAHVWFQSAVICFIQQEFKESERFIQRFLQSTPSNELLHLQCIAQVFNLILQIELNNERYIPYALRNVQRFLTTRKKAFEGEKKIFQFIHETLKKRKNIQDKELWNWLENELHEVKKTDPLFFTYFDFHKWAKARALKTSFASVVFE